ncbi:nonsense-mediated mRNA decay factor SMG7-like [Diospyros lotus]|uniref:nonsense-mediated mRNA decay factor SMG7-like n=1 Tax=Diospyros lotus TaxID=55363 RepID=UPI002258C7D6|nr:nonsense-mediated mRNA decay factor SMG7-like [Diospyros lotus]XP_052197061.1 nonsense-mediated mRNA decay factor SMG7-like [Diospyros lotus]XP_052197069.1 nonsense-mediated mRNA decay factor SMG7-like [Diospyros lotus]
MMIVQMDKMSAPSSRELAQRLYDKNMELENRRRKSAQARVPSDPNAWQQMRENYEAIILEDHVFSEQHNIEYALWQLHYRRIEEFRTHFSSALASSTSLKGPPRPDRVSKIRLQFKTFLSEATGFYHDLILKIKAKYGLPLGYFSEDSDNRSVMDKDGKRSVDMKKGLISCHRCLIYLGDLARYKGLYGEGDSKGRDYAAASSYYLQAVSLWHSSGNPHHQLAILATYSGDELVAVYRYFRSLAVDNPFSTAKDNLTVAFEKNRLIYCKLHEATKASTTSESSWQLTAKGRGKAEAKLQSKSPSIGTTIVSERATSVYDPYKTFCISFVRLNGILFTRTSLETFAEVLALASSTLVELLSSGPAEELNFGPDAAENGLVIVRLISILIFTVNSASRDGEGQNYADIVQRRVFIQNALGAVFELVGHILMRCAQLHDPCSSYLLPGILVFMEWLASCPDVAAGSDIDDKQETVRSKFWNHWISLLNKLLSAGLAIMDAEDGTHFFNMSRYEEGETEKRFALWEDFELRGFLPLHRAQSSLDFSRKFSVGGDGNKEKSARVKRILAAGKSLVNVVKVDQNTIIFDHVRNFLFGSEPPASNDFIIMPFSGSPEVDGVNQILPTESAKNATVVQPKAQVYMEGEEEDEVIVFKPTLPEKRSDLTISKGIPNEGLEPETYELADSFQWRDGSVSAHHNNLRQLSAFNTNPKASVSVANHIMQHLQPTQPHSPMLDQQASLANTLNSLSILENGHLTKPGMQADLTSRNTLAGKEQFHEGSVSACLSDRRLHTAFNGNPPPPVSVGNQNLSHMQPIHLHHSGWLDQQASLANGLKGSNILENGYVRKSGMQHELPISHYTSLSLPVQQSVDANPSGIAYSLAKASEMIMQSKIDNISSSGFTSSSFPVNTSPTLSTSSRKSPVSRPARHIGPPPGFNSVPRKPANEPMSESDLMADNLPMDDYSWLDGYKLPLPMTASEFSESIKHSSQIIPHSVSKHNEIVGPSSFPFPGKQVPAQQFPLEKQNGWEGAHSLEHLNLQHQQLHLQQLIKGSQQFIPLPEQHQRQSIWTGHPPV